MDSYINYLLTKYFIFKSGVELIHGNEIEDKNQITSIINCKAKTDNDFLNLTREILVNFLCFDISVLIDISNRILEDKVEDIFFHYKKYKCSGVRETETYLNLDYNLDTSKTEWVESIDIKTQFLVEKYGKYIKTGNGEDKHRFEYKFEFINKGKKWIFSLYDYLNTADEFDDEIDIYWHVASNVKNGEIIKCFIEKLNETMDCC